MRVEYADGKTETVVSDTSWRTSEGPITYDSIYGGETYDARREILTICHEHLPSHKVPAVIRFVPALAVAAAGKLNRYA